jgi:hypothetical protein
VDTDDILSYRRLLAKTDIGTVPKPTVYATNEWLDTVHNMALQIPADDEGLVFPSQADCGWSWAETGLLVLFERPMPMVHIITSETDPHTHKKRAIEPELEHMDVESVLFSAEFLAPVSVANEDKEGWVVGEDEGGYIDRRMLSTGVLWIAPLDPNLAHIPLSSAYVCFEWKVFSNPKLGMSESTRFLYSMLIALGHRMTTATPMSYVNNPQRRRYVRSGLPPVRTLTLTPPPSVATTGSRPVNWTRSWKVRTHWRNQACGPKMRQHRRVLIHEYEKQTHLPPDVRPTVWETR